MKTIYLLALCFACAFVQAQGYEYTKPKTTTPTGTSTYLNLMSQKQSQTTYESNIENGWYAATLNYTNYTTYTSSTYTLNVYVNADRVTVITFGNGGTVHIGTNNEGYIYTGGYLDFVEDDTGDLTEASTTVSVTYLSSSTVSKKFEILIENL